MVKFRAALHLSRDGINLNSDGRPPRLDLRKAGLILVITLLVSCAVALPAFAWIARKQNTAFQYYAGWANILALPAAIIGIIGVLAAKLRDLSDLSVQRLNRIADRIASETLYRESFVLSQLLATDGPDRRPAAVHFVESKDSTKKRSNGKKAGKRQREISEVVDFFLKETHGRMVVLGAPGTGKTVLAVSLIVGIIRQKGEAGHSVGDPVPVLFNLSSWNPHEVDTADWLESQISQRFQLSRKVSSRLIRDGWILPVLDGLDEMDPNSGTRRSTMAVDKINRFIAAASHPRLVLISRSEPKFYERLARKVRDSVEISLQTLGPKQIIDYVRLQCPDEIDRKAWQPVFEVVRDTRHPEVRHALGTPWRLTAAITFYLSGGNPADLAPCRDEPRPKKSQPPQTEAYSERVRMLLMEAFISARIRLHRRRGISPAISFEWLRMIAVKLKESDSTSDNEIILHDWWKMFDRAKISIWQGLLTMFVTLQLPWVPFGIFGIPHSPESNGRLAGIAILLNSLTIALFSIQRAQKHVEPRAIQLRSLSDPRRLIIMVIAVIASAGLGFLGAVVFSTFYGLSIGLIFGAMGIIGSATSTLSAHFARPLDMLLNDRNHHVIIGALYAAYAIFYFVPLYGLEYALMFASAIFAGYLSSSAYIRYAVAVTYGFRHGFPFRFARFVRWAHAAGILRISGIGYQFRHQELLDYLRAS